MAKVQIPAAAVASAGDDVSVPLAQLLRDLSLLPTKDDLEKSSKLTTAITGTPDSVAVIEAGATAVSKAWAAGLGVAATTLWGSVVKLWDGNEAQRGVMLWVAGIVSAAAVLAIGYIVSSDVGGRAAATVATYEARWQVAVAMLVGAQAVHESQEDADNEWDVLALPAALTVKNTSVAGADESGWKALVIRSSKGETEYWLIKGSRHAWVKASDVELT